MKNSIFTIMAVLSFSMAVMAQANSNVSLVYNWTNPSLPPSTAHNNTYNEVWGYNANGREYAIIGSTFGTHFFDVTNPSATSLIQTVAGAAQGGSIIHRDYHDYAGYLYMVCDEGSSTLQIVNLNYLPDSVSKVYDSSSLFRRAHNIYIDTTNALMYACGVASFARGYVGLEVYSLSNPIAPQLLYYTSAYGLIHDVYVRNNIAYLNAGYDKLVVVDFSTPTAPVTLGSLTSYPFSGYNHSGWLNDDGTIYVFADENHGMNIKVADVSDPTDIKIKSTFTSGVTSNSIPHNLIIKGDYVYVSYYFDGFYIFNIADPLNPFLTGFYDTSTEINNNTYKGAWGVYPYLPSGRVLVSDMQSGLYVLDPTLALTGIEHIASKNKLSIFPNPSSGHFNIYPGEKVFSDNAILKIIDISGRIVFEKDIETGNRNLEINKELQKGIYIVEVRENNSLRTEKLIVR